MIALFVKRQEYWRLHDAHALAANHTEDGMVVSPLFGTVRGRAAIEKTYFELFQVFDDFALVSDEIVRIAGVPANLSGSCGQRGEQQHERYARHAR